MAFLKKKQNAKVVQVERIASQNLSALRIVNSEDPDTVKLADPDSLYLDSRSLGLTITSGTAGSKVKIVTFGEVKDAFFSFAKNVPLYLGAAGVVTDTPPTTGFNVFIGHSLGPGAIFINIEEPIEL